jgi:hypothetical protein
MVPPAISMSLYFPDLRRASSAPGVSATMGGLDYMEFIFAGPDHDVGDHQRLLVTWLSSFYSSAKFQTGTIEAMLVSPTAELGDRRSASCARRCRSGACCVGAIVMVTSPRCSSRDCRVQRRVRDGRASWC